MNLILTLLKFKFQLNMSQMQELTELKNLVIQSLEANGSLAKIRAQIRASVFNVVDQQDGQPKKPSPFFWENNKAQSIYDMQGGREILELIKDFLQTFDMHYTLSIFQSESNLREDVNREALARKFNLDINDGKPLLHQAVFNQKPPRDSIKSNNEEVQQRQQQEVQQQQQQLQQQKRQQELQKQEQQRQEQARLEQQRKEEQLREQKRQEQLREQERQEQLRREQQERKEQERKEELQRQEQIKQEQIKEQQRQEQLRQQEQARKEQEKKELEKQKQEQLKQEQLRQEQLQKQEMLKQQQKMEEQRRAINPPQKTEEYEDEQFEEEVEEDAQMYEDMGESGLKKQGQEGGFGSSEEFMQGSQSQGFDMTVDSVALEEFDYYEDVEDM